MEAQAIQSPTQRRTHTWFARGLLAISAAGMLTLLGAIHHTRSTPVAEATVAETDGVEVVTANVDQDRPTIELMYDSAPTVLQTLEMEVTAYCACTRCCGPNAQGITASGKRVTHNNGMFVAADTRLLPFGTKLIIPGYANDQPVEVIDRGGAIKGNKLDVYFHDHQTAREWGRQKLIVTVVE
jgi:3D (Asp-Asp-Asp) domain-containing protein